MEYAPQTPELLQSYIFLIMDSGKQRSGHKTMSDMNKSVQYNAHQATPFIFLRTII